METFGERLRWARKTRTNLTQVELGGRLGTPNQVQRWEQGRTEKPEDPSMLVRLAQELGVSVVWLATGEGSAEPSGGADDLPTPALERFLATNPLGQEATPQERAMLRRWPWPERVPTDRAYAYLLLALRECTESGAQPRSVSR